MGNCTSNHNPSSPSLDTLVDLDMPSPHTLNHATTHIIVHSADTLFGHPLPNESPLQDIWLFEYSLNLGPICLGQHVVLHLRAEDCFNPDPTLRPVAEGWVSRV